MAQARKATAKKTSATASRSAAKATATKTPAKSAVTKAAATKPAAKKTAAPKAAKKAATKTASAAKKPAAKAAPKAASAKAAPAKKATASAKPASKAPAKKAASPKKAAPKAATSKPASASKTTASKPAAAKKTASKPAAKATAGSKAAKPVSSTRDKIAAAATAAKSNAAKKARIFVGTHSAESKGAKGSSRIAAAAIRPIAPKKTAPVEDTKSSEKDADSKKAVGQRHGFKLHEYVVYPAHGVGQIVGIEEQEIAGMKLELFVITFDKDKMTLRVPTSNLEGVGLRKLVEDDRMAKALKTLTGRARVKRTMWSRRAQEYEAKINSGDLISIAEVVRDLYRSDNQPEQSYSERQLYEQALDRMARELAVVEGLDERASVEKLTGILSKSAKGRRDAEEAAAAEAAGDDDDVAAA
jgi:CarD family transcriptional regulator